MKMKKKVHYIYIYLYNEMKLLLNFYYIEL